MFLKYLLLQRVTSDTALNEMVENLDLWFPQISVDHESGLSQRCLQNRKTKNNNNNNGQRQMKRHENKSTVF